MSFENYFEMSVKMFRSMTTGLFLYPLFVALSESFDLNTHYYLPLDSVIRIGTVFLVISMIFFPLAKYSSALLARGAVNPDRLGKKLFISYILSVGCSETIAVFGLIIYIVTADVRFFYLFFILAFVHLVLHRPKKPDWQKHLDRI